MAYRLVITDRAEYLLEQLIDYILYKFNNGSAAKHMLDCLEQLYNRLEDNPYQFAGCKDSFLQNKGYREAFFSDMDYVLIFRIEGNIVYVLGIFHQLENYKNKL